MQYRCSRSGKRVNCLTLLGKGGEGEVFATDIDGMVAKIYHPQKRPGTEMVAKLRHMIDNTPEQPHSDDNHIAITWPRDLLEQDGVVHGFLMDTSDGEAVEQVVTPSSRKRRFPGQTWKHSLVTAYNLSWVMANIHATGYVIGDVNEQNIRAQAGGVVSIIDTDSFQISNPANGKVYPCTVMTPDFAAPEVTAEIMNKGLRRPDQDCFSLAIIIYRLLMCGNHPFNGVYLLADDPPEQRAAIVKGFTVLNPKGPYAPRPKAPPVSILPPALARLFERTFLEGHGNPAVRPNALEWKDALLTMLNSPKSLVDCPDNMMHVYSSHLPACPWCELFRLQKVDYYDPRATTPKTQINRPKTYSPSPTRILSRVAGAQVRVPVRTFQPTPMPTPPPQPSTNVSASSGTSVVQPSRTSTTTVLAGGHPASFAFVLGYGARVVLALAVIGLSIWLNFSSLLWPIPDWHGVVWRIRQLGRQAETWLDTGWRWYFPDAPAMVFVPSSKPVEKAEGAG